MESKFIDRTIELAFQNVENGGRPFACIVVNGNDEVVAESPNLVAQTNDPTAHAEIVALRQACQRLGTEHLRGHDVYVLAHPCPMCLGALYYCSPARVIFVTEREDYAEHYTDSREYFEFGEFYDEFGKSWQERNLPLIYEPREAGIEVYQHWETLNED